MKSGLLKAIDLIQQGWCRDVLGKDARGNPCDHQGNLIETRDKQGKTIHSEFRPAVKWSLVGALMKVADDCPDYDTPYAFFDVVMSSVALRGYTYLADFNNDKKVSVDDVLCVLRESLVPAAPLASPAI